jgi:hypothetical protein
VASRKDEKERRRQERLQQQKVHEEQARRRRIYTFVAGGTLVVAAIAAIVVTVAAGGGGGGGGGSKGLSVRAADPPAQKTSDLTVAAQKAGCKLTNPPIEGREHTLKPVKYHTNPPSSGNHNPVPAQDGTYGTAPGIGHLVHSLEHGRIEIQFAPSTSRARLAQLKGLFDEDPYHMILTPNPTHMPYQIAVVAWGHIAGCKRFTDSTFDVIRAFTSRYRDKGPEFIP